MFFQRLLASTVAATVSREVPVAGSTIVSHFQRDDQVWRGTDVTAENKGNNQKNEDREKVLQGPTGGSFTARGTRLAYGCNFE